jgi:hypothetical protein
MQQFATQYIRGNPPVAKDRSAAVGVGLMALAAVIAFFVLLGLAGAFEAYPYLFLLPWILGLALVMIAPSAFLIYKGRFSFADPIVFATFSFFFPAFVVGGFFLAGGWAQPYFFSLIQDPAYDIPYTIVLIALGFASLSAGYFLPLGERIGGYVVDKLPRADYSLPSFALPGVLLLILGVMNTIIAFGLGVFGFQKGDEISQWDGLIYLTTLFWLQASFLLWFLIFRQRQFNVVLIPIIALLIATALSKMAFAGNRGSMVQIFAVIGLAYILSGRRFKLKQSIVAGIILVICLIFGMIWGTTFRSIKGTEARQSVDQYTESVFKTMDQVGQNSFYDSFNLGLVSLTERMDVLSSVAVVVSNHEELRPYEEAYGLDNNIWVDSTTFFIPRIIWKDKPLASDLRKYSDLYFNFGESSFAITPIADLLRNFGVIGIVLGMAFLGLVLRIVYRALVEGQPPSVWRLTLYFMLLTSVSYEAFFGTIVPNLFKVGITAVVGILIVCVLARLINGRGAPGVAVSR